ncbi:MAG: hypothetical protein NVSMB8_04610 [Candidatus Limnocylindrales bacterium]
MNEPVPPVATSTASDGALIPTCCSRTCTVALEPPVTVQIPPAGTAGAVVGAVVGGGDAVAVRSGPGVAATQEAPNTSAANMTTANRRAAPAWIELIG